MNSKNENSDLDNIVITGEQVLEKSVIADQSESES
jgi:hypothetical protein